MPDFSLGLGNLYGRFVKDDKQPVRRSTGGGQSRSTAYSQRNPSPKSIGGPLSGLGEAATSTALGLGNVLGRLYESGRQVSGDVQEISGKTQEAIGKAGAAITGAPGAVVGGVTQPVGQLSKDILPLAAIAAAVLLLRN
jgi:uncharacterized protein YjbJ (UPF0337 family)